MEDLQGRVMLLERRLQLLSEELSLVLSHSPGNGGPAAADAVNGEPATSSAGPRDGDDPAPFPAEAHIDADNIASRRVAEKAGFIETGIVNDESRAGTISARVLYARPVIRPSETRNGFARGADVERSPPSS